MVSFRYSVMLNLWTDGCSAHIEFTRESRHVLEYQLELDKNADKV
jgi:hypothetical protein